MATIAFVHVWLHGHVAPASRLAAVLTCLGHRCIALAPESFRGQVEASGAELRPVLELPPGEPLPDHDAVAAGIALMTPMLCELCIRDLAAEDVDIVVHDSMAPWGRVAAIWLGLPRVCSFAAFPAPAFASELRTAPPAAEHLDALMSSRDAVVRKWGVELGGFGDLLTNPGDLTVSYTTPEVAGTEFADPKWRMVGPLMTPPARPDRLSAGDARPLVYVALGTLFSRRAAVFRAPMEALADADVRVLLSTGGAPVEELGPLPENVTAVTWADSWEALASAAVHVTHGGAGSVHESLLAETPMVCLPQGSDHHGWARRIEELGVGEVVSEPEPEAVRAAVLRVLADEAPRRRIRELADHLRAYPGPSMVRDAVQSLLR